MNVPVVVGGAAAVVGIAAGVLSERMTHSSLETKKDRVQHESSAWLNGVNGEFGDEITADRLRNRDLDARIEDYKLEHPKPGSVSWGRDGASYGSNVDMPGRDGFWGLTIGAGLAGGAIVGGGTIGIASDAAAGAGQRVGFAVGAAILGAGLGVAVGSTISNMTH